MKKKETNLIVRLGLWPVGTVAEAVQTDCHGEERNRCRSAIPIFAIASPPNDLLERILALQLSTGH